jgi:hypothetical protein
MLLEKEKKKSKSKQLYGKWKDENEDFGINDDDKEEINEVIHKLEDSIQNKWKIEKVFEVNIDNNNNVEKCLITSPVPLGERTIDLNRAYSWLITDIYGNYKSLQGKKVLLATNFHGNASKLQVNILNFI